MEGFKAKTRGIEKGKLFEGEKLSLRVKTPQGTHLEGEKLEEEGD